MSIIDDAKVISASRDESRVFRNGMPWLKIVTEERTFEIVGKTLVEADAILATYEVLPSGWSRHISFTISERYVDRYDVTIQDKKEMQEAL